MKLFGNSRKASHVAGRGAQPRVRPSSYEEDDSLNSLFEEDLYPEQEAPAFEEEAAVYPPAEEAVSSAPAYRTAPAPTAAAEEPEDEEPEYEQPEYEQPEAAAPIEYDPPEEDLREDFSEPEERRQPKAKKEKPEKKAKKEKPKKKAKKARREKKKQPLRVLAILLVVLLALEGLYFFLIYTKNPFVKKWRDIYIQTAMSTMTHQWLATAFIPADVIDEVMTIRGNAMGSQIGKVSTWSKPAEPEKKPEKVVQEPERHEVEANVEDVTPYKPTKEEQEALEREAFFELFWELDQDSMDAYLLAHPDVLANGWSNIYINEAGFEKNGTSIQTSITINDVPEQVLAIDAKNGILIVRLQDTGYRGVMAIAKDPSRLSIEMCSHLGQYGDLCGDIALAHNGVLAMTASGFLDPGGAGNGGTLAGYCMSNGVDYGIHFNAWAYKRVELHDDDLLYIKDATDPVGEGCTDATEFQPAMIVDGEIIVSDYWTDTNPRACIGQTDKYELLFVCIEGRMPLEGCVGTDVNTISWIMKKHGCMQAMNVDGGTSAMMWFDGEYIVRSSNASLRYTGGRPLPNSFIYKRAD